MRVSNVSAAQCRWSPGVGTARGPIVVGVGAALGSRGTRSPDRRRGPPAADEAHLDGDEPPVGILGLAGSEHPGGADDDDAPAGARGVVVGVGLEGDDGATDGVREGAAGLRRDQHVTVAQGIGNRQDRRQRCLGVGDAADPGRTQQTEALLLTERLVRPILVGGRHHGLLAGYAEAAGGCGQARTSRPGSSGTPAVTDRPVTAAVMSAAQAVISSQFRKSPSGARIAVTMARSPTSSRLLSSRPGKTRWARAPVMVASGAATSVCGGSTATPSYGHDTAVTTSSGAERARASSRANLAPASAALEPSTPTTTGRAELP